jgi:hypothetical protein
MPRTLHRIAPALLAATLLLAPSLPAQATRDSVVQRRVAPGVTYRRIERPAGPWQLHVLAVDLRRPELHLRAVRACDALHGRERPSAIARRLRAEGVDVVGAINADFFDLEGGTGANENNVVVDGEVVKAVERTESPFDTFDNAHAQFAVTLAGAPRIERFHLVGVVRTPGGTRQLGAINADFPPRDTLALYTRWWGATTAAPPRTPSRRTARDSTPGAASDTTQSAPRAEVALVRVRGRGDTTVYVVRGRPSVGSGLAIPANGAVLAGSGAARADVERLRDGDTVVVATSLAPAIGPLSAVIGGWPRVVQGGRNVAASADSVEGTFPRFSQSRHPRSAVGISRDGKTLYLVAVDGRRATSVGMSLVELGDAMLALGAYDALNFDGGGSTALVLGDSVVNTPTDPTGERAVGNVLVVTRGTARPRHVPLPSDSLPASCVLGGNRDPDRVERK